MKFPNLTQVIESSQKRIKAFIEDPILERENRFDPQSIAEPSNDTLFLAFLFATCLGFALVVPMFGPLVAGCSALSYCLVRILGGKLSYRRFLGVCILELPVSISLWLLSRIGETVTSVVGLGSLGIAFSLLNMLAAYRSFVLCGLTKKAALLAIALLNCIGIVAVLACLLSLNTSLHYSSMPEVTYDLTR